MNYGDDDGGDVVHLLLPVEPYSKVCRRRRVGQISRVMFFVFFDLFNSDGRVRWRFVYHYYEPIPQSLYIF